jgi:hypothetical protein
MLPLGDGDWENMGKCRGLNSVYTWDMVYSNFNNTWNRLISVICATYHYSYEACTVE